MKKLGPIVLSLLFAGAALAGCSKTLTRADVRAEMTKSGIPEKYADCVTDKMIAQFGLEKLSSNGELSADEKAAATKIGADCVTADVTGAVGGATTTTAAP
jgi:hypothetical protein